MNLIKSIMKLFTKDYSSQIIFWSEQALDGIILAMESELICNEDKDIMTKVIEYWRNKSLEENTLEAKDRMYRIHKNNQSRFIEMSKANR